MYRWPEHDIHFKDFLTYQQKNRNEFINAIGKGETIIDIGAHAGSWSIPLAHKFERVYSYEPIHGNTLEYNVAQSGMKNIIVRRMLLSKDIGEKTIWIRQDNSGDNGIDLGAQHGRTPIRMPSVTLDSLQHEGRISGIKIDVQGHEHAILLGAENIIKQHQPILCCELVNGNKPAEKLLKDWGYELKIKSGKDWIWRKKDDISKGK